MDRLVITGALGHIGSWLIHNFSFSRFSQVILVDDLSSQRYVTLFNLPNDPSFSFIQGSIMDDEVAEVIASASVLIHLAAITDAASSVDRQQEVEEINFLGTKRIAETCLTSGTQLLFPSTTSVYGSQAEVVDETCSALRPQSPYATAKLQSELLLLNEPSLSNLDYCICRFGTIFGTSIGMRFHTAVNKFCWQAVTQQPITVWTTALDQYRPYLGVGDCGRAIGHILEENLFNRELYNVVTDNYTVRHVIDEIQLHIPSLSIDFVDSPIMNQLSYHVQGKKFESTGWKPDDKLSEGISDTITLLGSLTSSK